MVLIGPIDPMRLIFSLVNTLAKKKILSEGELENILRESLDENLSKSEKEEIVNKIMVRDKDDSEK